MLLLFPFLLSFSAALAATATSSNQIQSCHYCPEHRLEGEPVDCRDPDTGFKGRSVACSEADGYSGDLCLKQSGKREHFCEFE